MERSLMKQAGTTNTESREALDQGPVTKQYFADPKNVVTSLNRLRSTEVTSYLQYKQHAYMAVSLLSPGLKTEFEAHAAQELVHADRLASSSMSCNMSERGHDADERKQIPTCL